MTRIGQIVLAAVIYLLALLSLAAGVPKVLQMPQELGFLASIGLSGLAVSVLGCMQCLGGALLCWPRFRVAGAVLAGIGFLVSSIALLMGKNLWSGALSLLPLVALLVAVYLDRWGGTNAD